MTSPIFLFHGKVVFCRNLLLFFFKIFCYNTFVVRKRRHSLKKNDKKIQKNFDHTKDNITKENQGPLLCGKGPFSFTSSFYDLYNRCF